MIKSHLIFCIIFAFTSATHSKHNLFQDYFNKEIIFREDYCSMFCQGEPHTLCQKDNDTYACMSESRMSPEEIEEMKTALIFAHNGIRNRIADRMQVANMLELIWNDELAEMARKWLRQCRPYESDPCALLYQTNPGHEGHNHPDENFAATDSYCLVAQNRYFQPNLHYPSDLISNALQSWYHQRDSLKRPTVRFDSRLRYKAGSLLGENNFTHLALPELKFFGCDFARIFNGFLLVCNYHPYIRDSDEHFRFIQGAPGSMCPGERPLHNKDGFFTNICVGMRTHFAKGGQPKTESFKLHALVSCILSMLLGLQLNRAFTI